MVRTGRIQTTALALAMVAGAAMAFAQPAQAAMKHSRNLYVTGKRFAPATVKAGYVGAPGYTYGPPGPIRPMLIDPGLGGGFLGVGIFPSIGFFRGVPVLSAFRL